MQQQQIQEIQALKQQQQKLTVQTSQDLSQIKAFIPKLANRLNPIQVLLNRTQIITKAVLITLTTAVKLGRPEAYVQRIQEITEEYRQGRPLNENQRERIKQDLTAYQEQLRQAQVQQRQGGFSL